jgi:hypothetical protein
MQLVKDVVSVGLPMNLFDNPEVRKTVLMTTECGQNYIRTKPGGLQEHIHHPIVNIIMGVCSVLSTSYRSGNGPVGCLGCLFWHPTGPFPVSPVPVLAGEVAHRYRL